MGLFNREYSGKRRGRVEKEINYHQLIESLKDCSVSARYTNISKASNVYMEAVGLIEAAKELDDPITHLENVFMEAAVSSEDEFRVAWATCGKLLRMNIS